AVLGINIQSGNAQAGPGVVIGGAPGNMPAAKAGLRTSDRIISIDGKRVADAGGLRQILRSKSPGDVVVVGFVRDGAKGRVRGRRAGPSGIVQAQPRGRIEQLPRAATPPVAPIAPRPPVMRMPSFNGNNWVMPRQNSSAQAGSGRALDAQIDQLSRQIKAL